MMTCGGLGGRARGFVDDGDGSKFGSCSCLYRKER